MINWLKAGIKRLDDFSEIQIIQKAQTGKKEAFGQLYEQYVDGIYRYIFFRVNQKREVAEDLTESVFVKAWKAVNHFDKEKGTFRAWLYRIAHNSVIDHYRVTNKQISSEKLEEFASEIDLEEEFVRKEDAEHVQMALKELTDEQRDVVTMRFIEEFSHREIALVLNKQEDAIRALQYRALCKLREVLQNYEHTR